MVFDVTFDMDGVLADTRAATEAAYRHAGVEMPPGAWGKPAGEWLRDPEVHQLKHDYYPVMLRHFGSPLAGCDVVERLRDDGFKVGVVTNASWRSALAVFTWLELEVDGCFAGHKVDDLAALDPTLHVDDQPDDLAGNVLEYLDDADALYAQVVSRL